ncbi:MAG: hypothetical protein VYE73_14470 [Acidobacteriota bacterium]|nr:hypothetical protein [Acidobacteriota bacterium]
MRDRDTLSKVAGVAGALILCFSLPVLAEPTKKKDVADWSPPRLSDGQPDLNGIWNNVRAAHIPLEIPDEFLGVEMTPEERQAMVKARSDRGKARKWEGHDKSRGVGAYANYWFDWYWEEPLAGSAPALLIEPKTGKMPEMTEAGQESVAYYREHLHDSYTTMEAGDRCLTRGIYGMMMPTAYNNGKMFFHNEGTLVILSEMIHNSRVIPISSEPRPEGVEFLEGNPRGHWDGNTLVVQSTHFRPVGNLRGPGSRAPQTPNRHVEERFTMLDDETMRYELRVEDPGTYVEPWAVSFNYKKDSGYQQYEYACHEGNYSVPNSLSGARVEDRE